MTYASPAKSKSIFALGGVLVAMFLAFLISSPPKADAYWSAYCGGQTLGGQGYCVGAPRTYNAMAAYGVQHAVCVDDNTSNLACSAGPGAGIYSPHYNNWFTYDWPTVSNPAAGANTVYPAVWQQ